MKRIVGWLLTLTIASMVLLSASLAWIVRTEMGTQWMLRQVADVVPSLTIRWGSGALGAGLVLEAATYADANLRVDIDNLYVKVETPSLLLLERINLGVLRAERVAVQIFAAENTGTDVPDSAPTIPMTPLAVDVQALEIGSLTVGDLIIENVRLAAAWESRTITVERLDADINELHITHQGEVHPTDADINITQTLSWRLGERSGTLTAKGPLSRLAVRHELADAGVTQIETQGWVDLKGLPALEAELDHRLTAPAMRIRSTVQSDGSSWTVAAATQVAGEMAQLEMIAHPSADGWRLNISPGVIFPGVDVEGSLVVPSDGLPNGRLAFKAREFQQLLAGLEGTASGELKLDNNQLHWRVQAPHLKFDNVQLQQLMQSGSLQLTEALSIDTETQVQRVNVADTALQDLRARVSGTQEQLAFSLLGSTLDVRGRVDLQTPSQLSVLIDASSRIGLGEFVLTSQAPLRVDQRDDRLTISGHCWEGIGRWCLGGGQLDAFASGNLFGSFSDVPAALINEQTDVATIGEDGRLYGEWQLTLADGVWQLVGQASSTSVAARLPEMTAEEPLPDLSIAFDLSPERWVLDARSEDSGFAVEMAGEVRQGRDLQGRLTFRIAPQRLTPWLGPALAEQAQVAGTLTGQVELGGTIALPVFDASGNWEGGELKWMEPAIEMTDIGSNWRIRGEQWEIDTSAMVGDVGRVRLQASGVGLGNDVDAEAQLQGNELDLATEFGNVIASPRLKARVAEQKVTFGGQLTVADADIELSVLPTTVLQPSNDVVVQGRIDRAEQRAWTISGDVDVVINEKVRLALLGIDLQMLGQVKATVKDDELTALNGELQIVEGSVQARGDALRIRSGRVLFAGDPNNPYIELIAVRDVPNQNPPLQVGLRIRGPADELETTVYSDPLLSETRALSFLVLGRDFDASAETDNQQLVAAAIGFGLSRSQGVVEQLRNRLGLDELSALAAEQSEVAIVAAKQLTERLFVRYRYNALSQLGALIVRYHVTNRWRLEVSNDRGSSMDLLYEVTR